MVVIFGKTEEEEKLLHNAVAKLYAQIPFGKVTQAQAVKVALEEFLKNKKVKK